MIDDDPGGAVAEAGRLIRRLPKLWAAADLSERRRLLLTLLDAVYVDAREARAVVSVRPKAAFEAVLNDHALMAKAAPPSISVRHRLATEADIPSSLAKDVPF